MSDQQLIFFNCYTRPMSEEAIWRLTNEVEGIHVEALEDENED